MARLTGKMMVLKHKKRQINKKRTDQKTDLKTK